MYPQGYRGFDLEGLGYHDTLGFAVLADEWDFDSNRAKAGILWET